MMVLLTLLSSVGLALGVSYSDAAAYVKRLLRLDRLRMLSCGQCVGFWTGAAHGFFLFGTLPGALLMACASSGLARVASAAIYRLEKD